MHGVPSRALIPYSNRRGSDVLVHCTSSRRNSRLTAPPACTAEEALTPTQAEEHDDRDPPQGHRKTVAKDNGKIRGDSDVHASFFVSYPCGARGRAALRAAPPGDPAKRNGFGRCALLRQSRQILRAA
jgi:hypothetical protein